MTADDEVLRRLMQGEFEAGAVEARRQLQRYGINAATITFTNNTFTTAPLLYPIPPTAADVTLTRRLREHYQRCGGGADDMECAVCAHYMHEQRYEEREKQLEEAKANAETLLRSICSDAQWTEFRQFNFVTETAPSGRVWQITNSRTYGVYLLDDHGRRRTRMCVGPADSLPEADMIAAIMLGIRMDESLLFKVCDYSDGYFTKDEIRMTKYVEQLLHCDEEQVLRSSRMVNAAGTRLHITLPDNSDRWLGEVVLEEQKRRQTRQGPHKHGPIMRWFRW